MTRQGDYILLLPVFMRQEDREIHARQVCSNHSNEQIWYIDTAANTIHLLSGNGQEKNLNHPSDLLQSAWAQPSGLAICPSTEGQYLAVADRLDLFGVPMCHLTEN